MAKDIGYKLRILKVLEILQQETDETHPIKTQALLAKLSETGLECDRRTLYNDIELLQNCNFGIKKTRAGQNGNAYYVGSWSFKTEELRVLMDAVQASSFISVEDTKKFIDKIANLGGCHRAELLKSNTVLFNNTKHNNEKIFQSIRVIEKSITEHKKISFQYCDYNVDKIQILRKNGKRYTVNPYATIFSEQNYYLMCYKDDSSTVAPYRIDRMSDVRVLNEPVGVNDFIKKFDLQVYRKQLFGMYAGETIRVSVEADKSLIDAILDKFGEETALIDAQNGKFRFCAEVQESNLFYGWCCSFGTKLQVLHPASVAANLKKYMQEIVVKYGQ